ncbi:transposase [Candidatus Protochlamydia amoebophila]|uniref:transposase n=1 Tax=Candidatus Protochlamydia amoebophila TaxID=362787 RepID=UPI002351DDF7|nr:transposase [Candidatus Protochlamydia amoebophila]
MDESGINECLHRHSGRAFRGEKVYSVVSGHRFSRGNFIAAKCQSKMFTPFGYAGACHTILFNTWLEKILIPELKIGQVIIMDPCYFSQV